MLGGSGDRGGHSDVPLGDGSVESTLSYEIDGGGVGGESDVECI